MFLHEIPKGSKIEVTLNSGKKFFMTFHHIDGAYAYCTLDDGDSDNVVHLGVMTELEKTGDFYIIKK